MMRTFAQTVYPAVAGLFVACAIVQVFLAGLGVFDSPSAFVTHRGFGYLFGWLTLVMLVVALAGRMPRRFVGIGVLLLVLFALQSVFVALRDDLPAIAALHPLNGFFILGVGAVATRASWLYRLAATGAVAQPGSGATIALPGETA
jgi:mercuric ion transport protein